MLELCILFGLIIFAIAFAHRFCLDYLSPCYMIAFSFLISTFLAILGNRKWRAEVSIECVLLIFVYIIAFEIGCLISKRAILKMPKHGKIQGELQSKEYDVKAKRMLLIICVELFCLYVYYRKLLGVAYRVGYSGKKFVQYVRVALAVADLHIGAVGAVASSIFIPVSLISSYIILYNIRCRKKGILKYYFLPILSIAIGFVAIIISGARVGMIMMLYSFVFIAFFCSVGTSTKQVSIRNLFRYTILTAILLYFLFAFLGTFTGKTVVGDEMNNFFMYGGGALPAFSEWLSNRSFQIDNFGKLSFSGLYSLLEKFIPGIQPSLSTGIRHVVFPDGTSTNVFTCFRVYLFEFGIIGTFILMMLLGTIYTAVYNTIKYEKSIFRIVLYTYLSRDILYLIFTPSPTSNLLSVTQILNIFWMVLVGWIMFRRGFFEVRDIK